MASWGGGAEAAITAGKRIRPRDRGRRRHALSGVEGTCQMRSWHCPELALSEHNRRWQEQCRRFREQKHNNREQSRADRFGAIGSPHRAPIVSPLPRRNSSPSRSLTAIPKDRDVSFTSCHAIWKHSTLTWFAFCSVTRPPAPAAVWNRTDHQVRVCRYNNLHQSARCPIAHHVPLQYMHDWE